LARISRKYEWVEWWQLGVFFVISVYYAVIIAWAMFYSIFPLNLKWGDDTDEGFLLGDYLKLAETPGQLGSLVPGVLIPPIIVWVITLRVLFKGIKKELRLRIKSCCLPFSYYF